MTTLGSIIAESILNYAKDMLPEEAIKYDPNTRHRIIDLTYVPDDEIDIDALASLIAADLGKELAGKADER